MLGDTSAMASRIDISDHLIHFTRGTADMDAVSCLLNIARQGRLIGGSGMIRGGYRCVCFTEAPVPALAGGLVNSTAFTRYSQFGIRFEKAWVYARGGRPVIYQSEPEFDALPETMRWRHVRYNPVGDSVIDFTWEREWRLRCDDLPFSTADAMLVVPDPSWIHLILAAHERQQDAEIEAYSTMFNETIIEQMRQPFPWGIMPLSG